MECELLSPHHFSALSDKHYLLLVLQVVVVVMMMQFYMQYMYVPTYIYKDEWYILWVVCSICVSEEKSTGHTKVPRTVYSIFLFTVNVLSYLCSTDRVRGREKSVFISKRREIQSAFLNI